MDLMNKRLDAYLREQTRALYQICLFYTSRLRLEASGKTCFTYS